MGIPVPEKVEATAADDEQLARICHTPSTASARMIRPLWFG